MRTLHLFALVTLVCGGCVVVHDNGGGGGAGGGGGGGVGGGGGGGPPVYRVQPGASTVIVAGTQPGYGITASLGGTYRAVWTGQGPHAYNNFTGTIYTPGHFTDVTPGCSGNACPVEANDIFNAPFAVAGGGEQFTFDTVASTGIDGVDFTIDLEPVEFDLVIDGVRYPDLVFFTNTDTGSVVSPSTIPFDLTTN
jgi:hypothetical protein